MHGTCAFYGGGGGGGEGRHIVLTSSIQCSSKPRSIGGGGFASNFHRCRGTFPTPLPEKRKQQTIPKLARILPEFCPNFDQILTRMLPELLTKKKVWHFFLSPFNSVAVQNLSLPWGGGICNAIFAGGGGDRAGHISPKKGSHVDNTRSNWPRDTHLNSGRILTKFCANAARILTLASYGTDFYYVTVWPRRDFFNTLLWGRLEPSPLALSGYQHCDLLRGSFRAGHRSRNRHVMDPVTATRYSCLPLNFAKTDLRGSYGTGLYTWRYDQGVKHKSRLTWGLEDWNRSDWHFPVQHWINIAPLINWIRPMITSRRFSAKRGSIYR